MDDVSSVPDISTGGGAAVSSDLHVRRDFVGRDQHVSVFAGLSHSEMLSLRLVQRLERLYGLLRPLARFGRERHFRIGDARSLVQALEEWYFDEAGGMYLRFSPECYGAYVSLQEDLAKMTRTAPDDDDAVVEADRFEHCRQLGSALRHALSDYVAQTIALELRSRDSDNPSPAGTITLSDVRSGQ